MTMECEVTGQKACRSGRTKFSFILLTAGLLAPFGVAAAQSSLPDAQVEANVLKALAGSSDLASQPIQTHTVYGTVTLTGSVSNEAQRKQAESLASTTVGVKKVIDELTLGTSDAQAIVQTGVTSGSQVAQASGGQPDKLVLQSDGTYAPAQPDSAQPTTMEPQRNNPDADQALDQRMQQQQSANGGEQGTAYPQPSQQNGYPGAPNAPGNPPYPNQGRQPMYPAYPGYPPPPPGARQYGYGQPQQPMVGQQGGQTVVVPPNVTVPVRLNQRLSTEFAQPGQFFSGVVSADIVAGNAVAIPRGAQVQGKVVDVVKAGTLKGRGELSLELTEVTLGGRTFPIVSDTWNHHAGDKTLESINHTAIGGGLGALVGAAAGGGVGAAIGAGVGGVLGLGSAAASRDAQVYLPAEAVLTFHLAQPATITTVSQEEMQRLAYGVPNGGQPPSFPRRRIYPYPPVYYAPGYYRPYSPYPYPY